MRQKGFATLEVILMVMVIGILASIAVPRFSVVTAAANTAKIQSDLSTIDTAIAIYYMEKGEYPTDIVSDLGDYLQDVDSLKPPTGNAYVNGTLTSISDTNYSIQAGTGTEEARAILDGNTAGEFTNKEKNNT